MGETHRRKVTQSFYEETHRSSGYMLSTIGSATRKVPGAQLLGLLVAQLRRLLRPAPKIGFSCQGDPLRCDLIIDGQKQPPVVVKELQT